MIVNRISITITDAQKTEVNDATAVLANLTENWRVPVSKEEIKSLSKISDGSIPFVEKVMQYAVSNPEFLQPNADVGEAQKDFNSFMDLREIVRPMWIVVDNVENAMYVCGNEAGQFARNYYSSVQYNAKMGVPGAQAIYDDLRVFFEKSKSKPTE